MVELSSTKQGDNMWEIWDPFEDMRLLQRGLGRNLKDFWDRPMELRNKMLVREPLADIIEAKDKFYAKVELPGIEKKDIKLNVTDNLLTINAEKKSDVKEEKEGFLRHERSFQCFQRAFQLPVKVLPDKTSAKLENGVLEITLPKATPALEENKVKHIEIQ